jgi:hypothetical protein
MTRHCGSGPPASKPCLCAYTPGTRTARSSCSAAAWEHRRAASPARTPRGGTRSTALSAPCPRRPSPPSGAAGSRTRTAARTRCRTRTPRRGSGTAARRRERRRGHPRPPPRRAPPSPARAASLRGSRPPPGHRTLAEMRVPRPRASSWRLATGGCKKREIPMSFRGGLEEREDGWSHGGDSAQYQPWGKPGESGRKRSRRPGGSIPARQWEILILTAGPPTGSILVFFGIFWIYFSEDKRPDDITCSLFSIDIAWPRVAGRAHRRSRSARSCLGPGVAGAPAAARTV